MQFLIQFFFDELHVYVTWYDWKYFLWI